MLEFLKLRKNGILVSIMGTVCGAVLLFGNDQLWPGQETVALLLLLTAASVGICILGWTDKRLAKYRTKGRIRAIAAVSLYAAFASWGQRLFLMDNGRMHAGIFDVLSLLAGAVWFVPVLFTILFALEWLSTVRRSVNNPLRRPQRWKIRLMLMLLFCAVQFVFLYSFWPGNFGKDGMSVVEQVAGGEALNNAHPVFFTLCVRFLYHLTGSFSAFICLQMAIGAWLLVEYLMLGWDVGIPEQLLALIGIVFLILPNQVMNVLTFSENIFYAYTLLLAVLLLIRFRMDEDNWKRPLFVVSVAVDLFLMMSLHYNGLLSALIISVIWIVIALRHQLKATEKRRQRLRLLVVPVIAMVLFGIMNGPIFTALHVVSDSSSPYESMLCAVGSCVNQKKILSQDAQAILEEVMPLADWAAYYSRYEGTKKYSDQREGGFDASDITLIKALRVYTEALFRYPDIVIKDRLDETDILWNVSQSSGALNIRYDDGIYGIPATSNYFDVQGMEKTKSGYINHDGLSDWWRKLIDFTSNTAWDMLLWRSGAYLIFLLVLLIYWRANNAKLMFSFVPLLVNLLITAWNNTYQSFHCVYFVQLLTMALAFVSVCVVITEKKAVSCRKNDEKGECFQDVGKSVPKKPINQH